MDEIIYEVLTRRQAYLKNQDRFRLRARTINGEKTFTVVVNKGKAVLIGDQRDTSLQVSSSGQF